MSVASTDPPSDIPITLRELLALAFYDRWAIGLGTLLPILAAIVFAALSTPLYQSSARLLVLPSTDYAARAPLSGTQSAIALDSAQIVAAEAEVLGNRSMLLAMLDDLGVPALYPDLHGQDQEAALLRLQRDLVIEPVSAASTVHLSLRNADPARAESALAALLTTYFARRPAILHQDTAPATRPEEELLSGRLRNAELALYRFAQEHGVADLPDQQARLLRLRADLRDNRDEAAALVSTRAAELAALSREAAATPAEVRASTSNGLIRDLESAKSALLTLQLQRKDLVSRFSETSREVANVDLQIATVRNFIGNERFRPQNSVRDARNPALGELERRVATLSGELEAATARRDTASAQIDTVTQQLDALAASRAEFERLSRTERTLAEAFRQFVPREEEARIDDLVARNRPSNVRVIERPTPPDRVRGAWWATLLLGVALGVILGLTATFIRTSLRRTYVVAAEAQRDLPWPLLAAVDQT